MREAINVTSAHSTRICSTSEGHVSHSQRHSVRLLLVSSLLLLVPHTRAFGQDDPGSPGPFDVTRQEYDFGDTAFHPTGFPGPGVEVRGSVHYPTDLSSGPFPLIVFLHGRHATCFQGVTAFLEWPCAAGHSPILSFQGYDYVSSILASHGY